MDLPTAGKTAQILLPLLWQLCTLKLASGLLDAYGVDPSILHNELTTLKSQVATMSGQMATLQNTIRTMQDQLNATSDLAAKAAARPDHMPVGSTAHLTNTITNLGLHQHVVFDKVISNVGNAYSNMHGHFTSPVFGVYVFFITATNVPGHSVSLSLMLNGAPVAYTLAHGTAATAGQWETSKCSAVLKLKAGNQVWAQNEGAFSPIEELDGALYWWISCQSATR